MQKCKVFCNVRHTLSAGDIIYTVKHIYFKHSDAFKYITYPVECMAYAMNQGGTAKV